MDNSPSESGSGDNVDSWGTQKAVENAIKKARKAAQAREQAAISSNIANWTEAASILEQSSDVSEIDNVLKQLEDRLATAESAKYGEEFVKRMERSITSLRSRELMLREAQARPESSQYAFSKTPLNTNNIFNK